MLAWEEDQDITEDSIITFMADPYGTLTKALDMEMTHEGPASVGILNRCKRNALYIENGTVKIVRVAESEDDPAGDAFPDITLAEAMIEAVNELKSKNDEL